MMLRNDTTGRWAWITLLVVVLTVFYNDLGRLRNPLGEKTLPSWGPGQNDFQMGYAGALALHDNVNPYINDDDKYSPWLFPPVQIEGQAYKINYPPSQALLYVPLTVIYGTDWQAAARTWFYICLGALALMATIVWLIVRRLVDPALSPAMWVVFGCILVLNVGVELGLERGQSDNFFAGLCWLAVYLFIQRRLGLAMFFAVVATSIKGYPVLFCLGLGLLGLDRTTWKRIFVGGLAGAVLMVGPVVRFLPLGLKAVHYRSSMFWTYWYNHSFRNVLYHFSPLIAHKYTRFVLVGLALGVCGATWWWARRAWRRRTPGHELPIVLFAAASLATVIAYSNLSVAYNLILVLPGALILMASQARVARDLGLTPRQVNVFGACVLVTGFLLFKYRLHPGQADFSGFPAAGLGLMFLLALIGYISVRTLLRARDELDPGQREQQPDPAIEERLGAPEDVRAEVPG